MSNMNWSLVILVGLAFLSIAATAILVMLHYYGGKSEKLKHLNALIEQKEKKLNDLEDKRDEYDRAKKFLDEHERWESEKDNLVETVVTQERVIHELEEKKDGLNSEIIRLQPMVDGLKELEKDIENAKSDVDKLKEDRKKIESEIENIKKEKLKLEKEAGTLLAEQKTVKIDIANVESEYKRLTGLVKKLEEELKTKQEKLDLDIKALAEIESDIITDGAEKKNLEKTNAELEERKQKNEARIESQRKEIDVNEKKITQLKPEVSGLESRKASAEQWLKTNAPKLAHMDDLDRQIALRKEEYASIGKSIENAHAMLDKTLKEVSAGLDRLNKMNLTGVQTLRLSSFDGLKNGEGSFRLPNEKDCEPAFGVNDEAAALNNVEEYFKMNGFEVPDRLLYAFHTSLKTSDMSSLTVMAGVSGTGKSAIPKLYSEAMGIFFSPLAVEPRWDSPKDLMGFFNYVTNRYEPTPLARAMFQFQGLWEDDFKPECTLDKYMFMPMLDEMNLARIEYYFSEFLSKLEMRRLVAKSGELIGEHQSLVGLEIFGGCHKVIDGKQIDERSKYLFANLNTLFVGTMNEDETTQSLSDKVIDRANVLYFGKPRELKPPARDLERISKMRKRFPLEKATWTKWCKTVDQGALTGAIGILGQLNDQLVKFNRPFAHRTFQAMLAYISNYPAVNGMSDDERIRQALADQISMRIMPKLRGIAISQNQTTLRTIGDILTDRNCLNDEKLNAAFADAINAKGSGFFRWNGFDW